MSSPNTAFLPEGPHEKPSVPRPPVLAEAEQRERLLLGRTVLAIGVASIVLMVMWTGSVRPYIPIIGFAAAVLGYAAWRRFGAGSATRLRREAEENDCCLCLHCGYSLKGLPAIHRCPECGGPYDIEEVKRAWSTYLAAHRTCADPSAPAPPIIGRLERWHSFWRTICIAPVLAGVPLLASLSSSAWEAYPSLLAYTLLALTAAGILLAACVGRKINELSRQAYREKYTLCLSCGYCLRGLPDKHRCPECGTAYDIEDVKRKWSEYIANRAAKQLPW